jgi:hypothetical protein
MDNAKTENHPPLKSPLATTPRNDWFVSKNGIPKYQSKTGFPGQLRKNDTLNISTDP